MNATTAITMTPLLQALMDRAPHMQFFQFCRLLELQAPEHPGLGTQDHAMHEPVRFRPWPRMGFPASEVCSVEQDQEHPDRPPDVRTTFMGLYGVDAALPSHLINDIALRREGHDAVMAFLDIYHHRLVTLLHRVWSKYRYPVGFAPGGNDERSRDLLALVGFGLGNKPAQAGLPPARVLALLGLLNQRTRTAEGLAGVVASAIPGIKVDVEEFHPVWITVDAAARLGRAAGREDPFTKRGLGQGDVIGRRIRCRTNTVRITLHPRSAEQIDALLPGSIPYGDLMGFLRAYIGVKANAVLRMRVESALLPVPRLSEPRSRLAWTTLLRPTSPRTLDISLGRYEAFPSPSMTCGSACAAGAAA